MMHRTFAFLLAGLAGSLLACSGSSGGSGGASSSVAGTGAGNNGAGAAAATSSGSGMPASSSATGGASSSGSGGAGGNASSGSTSSGAGGGPLTFTGFCNGAKTSLTGAALAPNGIDPLPNVRVYAASQVNPYPAAYCDKCNMPIDPAYASTQSGDDGSFLLDLDLVPYGATVTFVVQIGRFRKVTTLPVTACQSAAVPKPARTLPGKSADGDIPKIAVSSGNQDHLDAILSALGITEYDCYEGRKTPGASTATCQQVPNKLIPDVLSNQAALSSYHMLFLSCAPGAYAYFGTKYNMPTINQNTASWVAAGGRMFAADTAYDYIEQAFPDAIIFGGPAAPPGVAQPVGGANIGCSSGAATKYPAKVEDPTLTKWLLSVGILSSPNVSIQGFIQPWSAVDSLPMSTTLIADGTFSMNPAACGTTKNIPLTAQFDVSPCGRVVFSSYHTLASVNPMGLTAQEKIMEYLVFEVAACHQ